MRLLPTRLSAFSDLAMEHLHRLKRHKVLLCLGLISWEFGVLSAAAGQAQSSLHLERQTSQVVAQGTLPAELTQTLTQIDTAASRQDLKAALQFYSPTFKTSDGLDRAGLEKALTDFWKRFTRVSYQTQVKNWKREGNALVAETITTITGVQPVNDRNLNLKATIHSRQVLTNNQITQQDILAEQTQLTSGQKPPTVDINLPERVKVGQDFQFDAVIKEPIGDDLLLGGAFERPVDPKDYFNEGAKGNLNLEALSSGGLFKTGKAPKTPQNLWISAIFMRETGINIITRRLSVSAK